MKQNWEIKPMLSSLIDICFSHIQVTKEKSFPKSMNETNHSQVTEFVLLVLSNSQELQPFLFLIFSLLYLAILPGNFLIILTVTSDSRLHTPMYFLLANLSFIDICVASFATPKMIADFLVEHKTISFDACLAQIFFVHLFTGSEMVILVSMAYDRYVAICKPLHYTTIMSRRVCIILVLISWCVGFIHTTSQLAFTVNLPFCGPNQVDSFFCDLPLVTKLACIDTYVGQPTNSCRQWLSFFEFLPAVGSLLHCDTHHS